MYVRTYALACTCAVYLVRGGLIIEANIPVQEFEGQRGEGAYNRENTVYGNPIRVHSNALKPQFLVFYASIVIANKAHSPCQD